MPAVAPLHARRGPERLVLIAGGGIGGLGAALALARRGIASHVLERRGGFAEEGAGIQIGPNGTKVLAQLGIADALAPYAARPDALRVLDASTGDLLASLPLGPWIERRHGAPYWVVHRQDLHGALLGRARGEPLVNIATSADITSVHTGGAAVTAGSADGRSWTGEALVAAQGLWSSLRRDIFRSGAPRYSGKMAGRAVIPIEDVPERSWRGDVCIWLAPGAHVVHYPVRAGKELALVVIFDEPQATTEWSTVLDADAIRRHVARFPARLRELLDQPRAWRAWSLHTLPDTPRLADGRIALLGDAAHPVLPFLAQGGVLALEDAIVLADCLATPGKSAVQGLSAYSRQRRGRVRRVARASRLNGEIYHLSGVMASLRNGALAALAPERIMARYDWLYGWTATGSRQ